MMAIIEDFLGPLWAYSALMLGSSSLVIIWFIPVVTHGAGIKCFLAFLRLIQRIEMCALAAALAWAALHIIQIRQNPSSIWLAMHFCFFVTALTSLVRQLYAPDIPDDATWSKPVLPKDIQINRH